MNIYATHCYTLYDLFSGNCKIQLYTYKHCITNKIYNL